MAKVPYGVTGNRAKNRNIGSCRWRAGMVTWISVMIITKNIWWKAVLCRITDLAGSCCSKDSCSVSESDGAHSSITGVSSPCPDTFSISSGNRSSWTPSIFSCPWLSVSAVGVDNISKSVGERPSSSPSSPLTLPC